MIRRILIAAVAVAMPLASRTAIAQPVALSSLRDGDTVKVWAVGPRLSGELGSFGGFRESILTLNALPLSAAPIVRARVPYAALRRVDVRRGEARSPIRMVLGGAAGYVSGAILGGIAGAALECAAGCDDEFGPLGGIVIGGFVGMIAGTATGIYLGARKRPKWVPVGLRP